MKAENISDALAFLDDDIIEETEIFRNRKKSYKTIWLRCLSAAACLCIALVAVFGALQYVPNSDFPLRGQGAGDNYLKGGDVEEYKYGGTFGSADSSISFPEGGVYLEITEWKRNYFYALVLGSENDDLTIGMKVKVKLNKVKEYTKYPDGGVKVKLDGENGNHKCYYWSGWNENSYSQGRPTQEDFPVGSKVCVTFSKVRNSFLNPKAEKVIKATHLYEYRGEVPLRGPGEVDRVTYYIEIAKWEAEGFKGIIKGSEHNLGKLPLDKEVTVRFDSPILVTTFSEKGELGIPTEEDFPEGTRVKVVTDDFNAPHMLNESEIWISSIGKITTNQTILVRIDKWNQGGFTGTLCGENGQWAVYDKSQTAVVKFTDKTLLEEVLDEGTRRLSSAPTEDDFPVGTVMEIRYEKSARQSEDKTEYTAERLWLYKDSVPLGW